MQVGDIHAIPVSHGEGKFVVTAEEFAELRDNGQIWSQYVDFDGQPSMDSKYNPNGSLRYRRNYEQERPNHREDGPPERYEDGLFQNIPGQKDQKLFESAVVISKRVTNKVGLQEQAKRILFGLGRPGVFSLYKTKRI